MLTTGHESNLASFGPMDTVSIWMDCRSSNPIRFASNDIMMLTVQVVSLVAWWSLALSLILPSVMSQQQQEMESCACALERTNQTISCDANNEKLLQSMEILQTNDCGGSCLNALCQNAFFLIQAHHDYCFFNELPNSLSTIFHSFETKCTDCHILRKYNPALLSCPQPNCDNDSGKVAFELLNSNDCKSDCSNPDCSDSFQYLRAVYDICPDGTLDLIAELAVNDYDAPCAPYDCNTGAAGSITDLTCDPDGTLMTRPPAIPPPTLAPVPNVCRKVSDDETDERVTGDYESCSICGDNQCITKPTAVFSWPQRPEISCRDLELAGLEGYIQFDQCQALPSLANPTCGCQPADSYIEYLPPTVAPPENQTTETTTSHSKNTIGMGIGIGVGAVVLLSVLGVFLVQSQRNSKSIQRDETDMIEIPPMKQPRTEQELA